MPPVQKGHDCGSHYKRKNFEKPFRCDGCKMDGIGKGYQCSRCRNKLHVECRSPATTEVQHEQFEGSTFTFRKKPPTTEPTFCNACLKDIGGFSYHCQKKKLYLHPFCYNLKKIQQIGDTVFRLEANVKSKCEWCRKKKISSRRGHAPGLSYLSARREYHLHLSCMMELVHKVCERDGLKGLEKVELRKELARSDRNRGTGSGLIDLTITFVKILSGLISLVSGGDPTPALV